MSSKCPICNFEGTPIVDQQISMAGWVVFAVLLFVCIPLCWTPFVASGLKEDVYRCPNCNAKIGTA